MANINYFPTNLRYLRKLHHITQVQLGEKLDKTGSLINMWEYGKREATLDDVRACADLFGVSITDIVCVDMRQGDIDYLQTAAETELLEAFRSLNDVQQQAVLSMVKSIVASK